MHKYGRFVAGGQQPYEEYEGDYMVQQKEYVQIFKEGKSDRLVASIYLKQGESVREMS